MTEQMRAIRHSWQCANNRFKYLTDEKEIDSCIYLIKSLEMQYAILLKDQSPEDNSIAL
ncbi:MAG: hypothetical protein IKV30_00160 [Clostridia bacterium]|nr:hypothetical protein [Clostridia bacterium]